MGRAARSNAKGWADAAQAVDRIGKDGRAVGHPRHTPKQPSLSKLIAFQHTSDDVRSRLWGFFGVEPIALNEVTTLDPRSLKRIDRQELRGDHPARLVPGELYSVDLTIDGTNRREQLVFALQPNESDFAECMVAAFLPAGLYDPVSVVLGLGRIFEHPEIHFVYSSPTFGNPKLIDKNEAVALARAGKWAHRPGYSVGDPRPALLGTGIFHNIVQQPGISRSTTTMGDLISLTEANRIAITNGINYYRSINRDNDEALRIAKTMSNLGPDPETWPFQPQHVHRGAAGIPADAVTIIVSHSRPMFFTLDRQFL